jgi:hypothetical protein
VLGGRATLALGLATTLAAGCAIASPPRSSAASGALSVAASGELVVPALDPAVLGVTCGDGHAFHPALLEAAGTAETDADPAADALRRHLGSPQGADAPETGWVRVTSTPTHAQFVAPLQDRWAVVGFFVHGGRWELDLAGECTPQVVLPAGVSRAEWWLDPAFPPPGAGDRVIHLRISETACASGQSPQGRILPPAITTGQNAVSIAILVGSAPGAQDCQGNPQLGLQIELPEPLAGRPLFDATIFPPRGPLGSYALSCGPMDPRSCSFHAVDAVRAIEGDPDGPRVVSVEIVDAAGSYTIVMDDGSGVTMVVN